ncbi:Uncharacterised protein [Brucella neotomae]|nr:Uncharacterised protein [Brucella neotomae]
MRLRYGNAVLLDQLLVARQISFIDDAAGIGLTIKLRCAHLCLIGLGEIRFRLFQFFLQAGPPLHGNPDFIAEAFDNLVHLCSDLLLQRLPFCHKNRNFRAFQSAVRLQLIEMALHPRFFIAQVLDCGRSQYLRHGWRFIVVFQRLCGLQPCLRGGYCAGCGDNLRIQRHHTLRLKRYLPLLARKA